jgi:hypothetical protein
VAFVLLVVLLAGGGIVVKHVWPTAPTALLVVAGLSLLGLVLLGPAGFFLLVFLLAVLALLCIGALWLQEGDRGPRVASVHARVQDELTELTTTAGFTETLAATQTRWALTANRQGHGMAEDLEAALTRLAATGALTPQVRRELVTLTQAHLARVHALTEEGQASLVELAGRYDPGAAPRLWVRLLQERWRRRIPV